MSWGSRGEPQPNDSVVGGGELGLHSLEFQNSVSSATHSLRVHPYTNYDSSYATTMNRLDPRG